MSKKTIGKYKIEVSPTKKRDDWFYNNFGLRVTNYSERLDMYGFHCIPCQDAGKENYAITTRDPLDAIRHATTHKEFKNRWLELDKDTPKNVVEPLKQRRKTQEQSKNGST